MRSRRINSIEQPSASTSCTWCAAAHRGCRYNQVRCALYFFYRISLGKDWPKVEIVCAKVPKRLPVVLSREEVRQFFAAIKRIKTRAIFMTLYASGLRVS